MDLKLKERRMHGRRYWELGMRLKEKTCMEPYKEEKRKIKSYVAEQKRGKGKV